MELQDYKRGEKGCLNYFASIKHIKSLNARRKKVNICVNV